MNPGSWFLWAAVEAPTLQRCPAIVIGRGRRIVGAASTALDAADRFVTLVPEVDTPGHAAAFVRMRPELKSGRNEVEVEFPPGHPHKAVWLDPELPATFELVEEVLAGVAEIFPSPYIHIGGDEPLGMPHDLYASYVPRVREFVRSIGKRPLGWQESARAGLRAHDMIQYWFTDIALPASLPPEIRAQMDADLAKSQRDVETAVAASVPVIVSPLSNCYFDVPYAEPSADPTQAERQERVGQRLYSPMTVAESFEWEPRERRGTRSLARRAPPLDGGFRGGRRRCRCPRGSATDRMPRQRSWACRQVTAQLADTGQQAWARRLSDSPARGGAKCPRQSRRCPGFVLAAGKPALVRSPLWGQSM